MQLEILPIPIDKLGADTIWIIGCGPSLDVLGPDLEALSNSIVITINAALPCYRKQATYQIATDHHSTEKYHRKDHLWPVWVGPRWQALEPYDEHLRWALVQDLVPLELGNAKHTSGTAALLLALFLYLQSSLKIKKVFITGIDLCSIQRPNAKRFYQYAHKVAPHLLELNDQKALGVPRGFYSRPWTIAASANGAYRNQALSFSKILDQEPDFARSIECRSFCNLHNLKPHGKDFGWRQAAQIPEGCNGSVA